MNEEKTVLLRQVLEQGVGTDVVVQLHSPGIRAGLRAWFEGLTANQGPFFTIAPAGLRRHVVGMAFGNFAADCIRQMQNATAERVQVSRALLQQLSLTGTMSITPDQPLDSWNVTGPEFRVSIEVPNISEPQSDEALGQTAEKIMVPLMAAMAELIGYEEAGAGDDEYDTEGRVTHQTVRRRERSPRNRLLCLSIHGHRCAACGLVPEDRYREAGSIIEVHHLEPVSNLNAPRPYDPRTDLLPLCPNCHRAAHARRPVPYTPDELKEILNRAS